MIEYIGKPAMLDQLAEEATELAKAALKLARIYRAENPTPVTEGEAYKNLIEEYTDVETCARELCLRADPEIEAAKRQRFMTRIRSAKEENKMKMKEFTEDEKVIVKNIDKKFKWIARDKDKRMFVFASEPIRKDIHDMWESMDSIIAFPYSEMFEPIKWEDDKPTRISDIYNPQVLDDVEREYLKTILKPFHDKVDGVAKNSRNIFGNNYRREYLYIQFHDHDGKFEFPDFDSGKMYSGMELDKEYTLDELGITYTEDKA